MRHFILFVVLAFSQEFFAQEHFPTQITGITTLYNNPLEGVFVINKTSEKGVQTDKEGRFSIAVKKGDIVVFSSLMTKEMQVQVDEKLNITNFLVIELSAQSNQLREVVVRSYNGTNARALGIIPQDTKSYTAAERKLKTATDLKGAGGGICLDPVLNLISGRTAMLKKELAVEKKEDFMEMLEKLFDRNHFVNKLSIPEDYVKGFEYYAVENPYFTKILNSKNKVATEFLLGELALKYKDIIACENE
ncbi:carboxypeptidase-like regulatory domain-containing protein [Flavobacterium sp. TMP13]|uniref:carboxypeptidase-like regulatory domain-containing protein n=1 Tax=Flavobacterium sp. TMP13 TaxID=3425950 RepID=UPI003D78A4E2